MWNKQLIHTLLDHSDKAVYNALQAIYARQTASEQSMQMTHDANGVGFGYYDAEVLSDIAQKSRRYGGLTTNQCALVRKRIRKYWRQLADIANEAGRPVPERLLQLAGAQQASAPAARPVDAATAQARYEALMAEDEQETYRQIDQAELRASGIPNEMVAPGDHL